MSLNSQIDRAHTIFKTNDPECPRESAGVDDVEWSNEVVSKAVQAAGFHLVKVQNCVEGAKHVTDVDLDAMLHEGDAFLLDGYLNSKYLHGTKWRTNRVAGSAENRWRHSVAVVNYKVHDHPAFICGGEMSACNLWLDENATPSPKKGFMRQILKAYRVYKCTAPGTGCKGECHK